MRCRNDMVKTEDSNVCMQKREMAAPAPVTAYHEQLVKGLCSITATKHKGSALCRHTAVPVAWRWRRANAVHLIPRPSRDVQHMHIIHEAAC